MHIICYEKDLQFSQEIWAAKVHTSSEWFQGWKWKICRDQSRLTFSSRGELNFVLMATCTCALACIAWPFLSKLSMQRKQGSCNNKPQSCKEPGRETTLTACFCGFATMPMQSLWLRRSFPPNQKTDTPSYAGYLRFNASLHAGYFMFYVVISSSAYWGDVSTAVKRLMCD